MTTTHRMRCSALVMSLTAIATLTITASPPARADQLSSVDAIPNVAAPYSVPNFQKVSNGVWRGSAPSEKALGQLATSGVKTVIDLRMDGPGTRREETDASHLGMRYVHFPLSFKKPDSAKLKNILEVVSNPVNQPVFIHCAQGADRTGTVCALYRRIYMGWSFPRAYQEMRSHHFKPFLVSFRHAVQHPEKLNISAEDVARLTAAPTTDTARATPAGIPISSTELITQRPKQVN